MLFETAKGRSVMESLNIVFGVKRINVQIHAPGKYLDQNLIMRLHSFFISI